MTFILLLTTGHLLGILSKYLGKIINFELMLKLFYGEIVFSKD